MSVKMKESIAARLVCEAMNIPSRDSIVPQGEIDTATATQHLRKNMRTRRAVATRLGSVTYPATRAKSQHMNVSLKKKKRKSRYTSRQNRTIDLSRSQLSSLACAKAHDPEGHYQTPFHGWSGTSLHRLRTTTQDVGIFGIIWWFHTTRPAPHYENRNHFSST